jgi:hypothetical protein
LTVSPTDPLGRRAQPALAARYSLLELERASLTVEKGRALGIPIDTDAYERRRGQRALPVGVDGVAMNRAVLALGELPVFFRQCPPPGRII